MKRSLMIIAVLVALVGCSIASADELTTFLSPLPWITPVYTGDPEHDDCIDECMDIPGNWIGPCYEDCAWLLPVATAVPILFNSPLYLPLTIK